jgi:hypothetical protein
VLIYCGTVLPSNRSQSYNTPPPLPPQIPSIGGSLDAVLILGSFNMVKCYLATVLNRTLTALSPHPWTDPEHRRLPAARAPHPGVRHLRRGAPALNYTLFTIGSDCWVKFCDSKPSTVLPLRTEKCVSACRRRRRACRSSRRRRAALYDANHGV